MYKLHCIYPLKSCDENKKKASVVLRVFLTVKVGWMWYV